MKTLNFFFTKLTKPAGLFSSQLQLAIESFQLPESVIETLSPSFSSKNPPPIGIEVEVENVRPLVEGEYGTILWSIKPDGTLRDFGTELVSGVLSSSKEIGTTLAELKRLLENLSKHKFSWRTSIHVHTGVWDFDVMSFANFFLVYPAVEPLLFKVFADSRWSSVFCVPLIETKMNWNAAKEILDAARSKDESLNFYSTLVSGWTANNNKYAAANLSRIKDLGTIEFRHLAGTKDLKKIRDWIGCVANLISFCRDSDFKGTQERILGLKTEKDCLSLIKDVFGDLSMFKITPEAAKELIIPASRKVMEMLDAASQKSLLKITPDGGLAQLSKRVAAKRRNRAKVKYDS